MKIVFGILALLGLIYGVIQGLLGNWAEGCWFLILAKINYDEFNEK